MEESTEGGRGSKKERKNPETVKMYNLSTHTLSPYVITLLSKSLTFAPPNQPNPFVLFKDLNKFIIDLTVKRFYNIKTTKQQSPTGDTIESSPPDTNLPNDTDLPTLAHL